MKTKTVVETNVGKLKNDCWLSFYDEEGNAVLVSNDESIALAAKLWNMSPDAVESLKDAFQVMAQSIIEELEKDLIDIWNKVEE